MRRSRRDRVYLVYTGCALRPLRTCRLSVAGRRDVAMTELTGAVLRPVEHADEGRPSNPAPMMTTTAPLFRPSLTAATRFSPTAADHHPTPTAAKNRDSGRAPPPTRQQLIVAPVGGHLSPVGHEFCVRLSHGVSLASRDVNDRK